MCREKAVCHSILSQSDGRFASMQVTDHHVAYTRMSSTLSLVLHIPHQLTTHKKICKASCLLRRPEESEQLRDAPEPRTPQCALLTACLYDLILEGILCLRSSTTLSQSCLLFLAASVSVRRQSWSP